MPRHAENIYAAQRAMICRAAFTPLFEARRAAQRAVRAARCCAKTRAAPMRATRHAFFTTFSLRYADTLPLSFL